MAWHIEKYCSKNYPEKLPVELAKSGAVISDKLLVMSIMDLYLPTEVKHVFSFKKESDRNFSGVNSNILDLKSAIDNGTDLTKVYNVEAEVKDTTECLEDVQIEKDNIFSIM